MSNWRVILNSVDITASVSSWSASYAAENICGECTVEIADRDVLDGIIVPRVPRELSIQVDDLVDGSWTSRGAYYLEQITTPQDLNARTASIWGRSASARLTTPWAQKISKQWSAATTIAAIVAEVADLCGVTVSVALRGHCVGCPASQATVKGTVERILRDKVDPEITVREA